MVFCQYGWNVHGLKPLFPCAGCWLGMRPWTPEVEVNYHSSRKCFGVVFICIYIVLFIISSFAVAERFSEADVWKQFACIVVLACTIVSASLSLAIARSATHACSRSLIWYLTIVGIVNSSTLAIIDGLAVLPRVLSLNSSGLMVMAAVTGHFCTFLAFLMLALPVLVATGKHAMVVEFSLTESVLISLPSKDFVMLACATVVLICVPLLKPSRLRGSLSTVIRVPTKVAPVTIHNLDSLLPNNTSIGRAVNRASPKRNANVVSNLGDELESTGSCTSLRTIDYLFSAEMPDWSEAALKAWTAFRHTREDATKILAAVAPHRHDKIKRYWYQRYVNESTRMMTWIIPSKNDLLSHREISLRQLHESLELRDQMRDRYNMYFFTRGSRDVLNNSVLGVIRVFVEA